MFCSCRAYCKEIDFTVSPATASVFLIDIGRTIKLDLKDVRAYIKGAEDDPVLLYECEIAAKPVGEAWSDLVMELFDRLRTKSVECYVNVTCINFAVSINTPFN